VTPSLGVTAPVAARTAVRHMLIAWRLTDADWLDDAELVVSELGHARRLLRRWLHRISIQTRAYPAVPDNLRRPPTGG